MHRRRLLLVPVILVGMAAAWPLGAGRVPDDTPASPTIDELIALKRVGSPAISPDGRWVAYTVRETELGRERLPHRDLARRREVGRASAADQPREEVEHVAGVVARRLAARLRHGPRRQAADLSDRSARRRSAQADLGRRRRRQLRVVARRQVDRLHVDRREDRRPTRSARRSSASSTSSARTTACRTSGSSTSRAEGRRRLTSGAFTVGQFSWSPDGTQIAFDHRINADNSQRRHRRHLRRHRRRRHGPPARHAGRARHGPIWSPDGIADRVRDGDGEASSSLPNAAIAVVPAAGGRIENISAAFDEDPSIVGWTPTGSSSARPRTPGRISTASIRRHARSSRYRAGRAVDRLRLQPDARRTHGGVHRQRCGHLAGGLRVRRVAPMQPTQADRHGGAGRTRGATSALEVVSWKSQDGATIEGVLHKPVGFQAGQEVSAARRDPRRPDGHLAADAVQQHDDLSDRPLGREGRARPRAELSRQRRLRRAVPLAQRPQPRRRRRLGRAVGRSTT